MSKMKYKPWIDVIKRYSYSTFINNVGFVYLEFTWDVKFRKLKRFIIEAGDKVVYTLPCKNFSFIRAARMFAEYSRDLALMRTAEELKEFLENLPVPDCKDKEEKEDEDDEAWY